MTKAQRIHHAQRIKRKVEHYWTAGDKVKYKALDQRRYVEGWDGLCKHDGS